MQRGFLVLENTKENFLPSLWRVLLLISSKKLRLQEEESVPIQHDMQL